MLSSILERFIDQSPVSVIAQSLMLRVFRPERMDQLFEQFAQRQQQQHLLFSAQVDLMSLVVCGTSGCVVSVIEFNLFTYK